MPVGRYRGSAVFGDETIRLESDVVHSHEKAWDEGDDDRNHHAFEVVGVANLNGSRRFAIGSIEERVRRVVKGIEF